MHQVLSGTVIKGSNRARALGFPTLNIALADATVDGGVYAGTARVLGSEYAAAIFVDPKRTLLEAHLLGFAGDAYGASLTVELLQKIRDSLPYESDEAMRALIAADVAQVKVFFS